MSDKTNMTTQIQPPQVTEVRQAPVERQPERAPSSVAQGLSSADNQARSRDYQQYTSSHDFRTVESGSGDVTIIQSQHIGNQFDPERDQEEGVALSTHAQFRMFQNGGRSREDAEMRPQVEVPEADESREILSAGLRRGSFRV